MGSLSSDQRLVLARVFLSTGIGVNNPGDVTAPAASTTITAWDSIANDAQFAAIAKPARGIAVRRLAILAYVSHAVTVHIDGSIDGTNYDFTESQAISATTATTWDWSNVDMYPHLRVRIQESAGATLTTCRIAICGDYSDAASGTF